MIARIKSIKRKKSMYWSLYGIGYSYFPRFRVYVACYQTVVIAEMLIVAGTSGDFINGDLNLFVSISNDYRQDFTRLRNLFLFSLFIVYVVFKFVCWFNEGNNFNCLFHFVVGWWYINLFKWKVFIHIKINVS